MPQAGLRRFRWQALGTVCEIQCAGAEQGLEAEFFKAAQNWVARFEARYSRFRPDSLLSQINDAAGVRWVQVDEEMEQMLRICETLHTFTGGILDATALPLMKLWDYRAPQPRIPEPVEMERALELVGWPKVQRRSGGVFLPRRGMALDFGGWGKEFAVDAVTQIAREHGLPQVLIDFGHDLRALGAPPARPAWHVGLEDPNAPGTHRGSIAVRDCGVASSGDYLRCFTLWGRRYGHIIDPRTGWPVSNGCRQVTVIAPSCLEAGVLSTSAFILGPERGLRRIQDTFGAEGLLLTDHARYQTRGFISYVVEN